MAATVSVPPRFEPLVPGQEALRDSEERFRTLFDQASDGLLVADLETTAFLMGNEAISRMLGYSREEISRLQVRDIHPRSVASSALEAFEKMAKGESAFAADQAVQRKDGSVFRADITGSVIRLGARTYLLGAFRDVTDRKLAEERIRKMTARLEQRVHERTAQIESANRELEAFAYVVSHDLKAPLRAVASLSSWLAADYADKLDEAGRESLRLLVQRAKRMDGLITAILEYSRVGRAREDLKLVDLEVLVREVIELLSVPDQVEVIIETKLPTLLCGRTSVYQLFQNLIGNAVQHLDRPAGRIRVGCLGGGPTFYVADDGPGIEARYFDKIFEMFQTLASKEGGTSTGVGLTIVKKIVELYGGRVWVESTVGEGSTFWFTLPRAAAPEAPHGISATSPERAP